MKVSELMKSLHEVENRMGDVEVQVYSEDYCLDLHRIEDVTKGWFDGWGDEHGDVIGICITK